jgi:hypothetical protein
LKGKILIMKKKIIIAALALAICANAAFLTSCGGNNETTDGRGEGNTTNTTDGDKNPVSEAVSDVGEAVTDIVDGITGNGNGEHTRNGAMFSQGK